jgi:hypothetical protein
MGIEIKKGIRENLLLIPQVSLQGFKPRVF